MEKIGTYFILLFLVLIFSRCEKYKEIELELPFEGEKMVAYGTISNTGIARVEIWLTSNLNTNQSTTVPEEVVAEIIDQNGQIFPLVFDENIGYANIPLATNNTYFLSATYRDFSITSEEILIPTVANIVDYTLTFDVDTTELTIKTKFQDDEATVNSYAYEVLKIENGILIEKEPADFNNLITDKEFNGQVYELVIQEQKEVPIFGNQGLIRVANIDKFIINIFNVSKEINSFYESLKNTNGEIGNQFSEQDPLETNIQNGYGYFGGIAIDSIVIDL